MKKKDVLLTAIQKLESFFEKLTIVEVGTIRDTRAPYVDGDGHSTRYIAEHVKGKGHTFYSIDIETAVCRDYLKEIGLSDTVTLIKQDGLLFLQGLEDRSAHLIYLDGANEPEPTLEQYLVALNKVVSGGMIILDDHFPESEDVVKCKAVYAYLQNTKTEFLEINNMLVIQC